MKKLFAVIAVLMLAAAVVLLAQSTAKDKTKAAGSSAKTAAQDTGSAAKGTATKAKDKATPSSAKMDINTASREDLMTLPGIGDKTADKIIAGRPYKAKSYLVKNKIITQAEYEKIKDKIIAHQAKAATGATKKK